MAIVRRRSDQNERGYGVIGGVFSQADGNPSFSLSGIAEEIGPSLELNRDTDTYEPAEVTYIKLLWRASIKTLVTDFNRTDTFHTPSEKRRYGRYILKAGEYVTADGFHSYNAEMFKIGICKFILVGVNIPEDIPCDQPNVTIGGPSIEVPPQVAYAAYSAPDGFTNDQNELVSGKINADFFQYFPDPNVQAYQLGVTFLFSSWGLSLEQWADNGFPPTLLF